MTGYLTASEAATYLKFPNLKAFHAFLYRRRKRGIPLKTYRRNGTLLFRQADLESLLSVEQPSRFRRSA